MSGVDSRIVTMKFDNAAFEKGVSSTMSMMDKLKNSLNFSGKDNGLSNIQASADKVSLASISDQTHKVSNSFLAMATVAITALSNITTKALSLGTNMAKSLTGIEAMRAGFSDYELKVGATQTIMAGTGENIGTVTKYLKDLDIYADKTIYSLSDMTSNIGKFTNAGVKLPVAVDAMKGIANVAALSGANAEEAARAMYNLGQAIGQGTVKLMDWKSVELANMGTMEFKQQLINAAVATGTLKKSGDGLTKTLKGNAVDTKNFTTTLAEGWLTSKALTDTLSAYADETTDIGKRAYAAAKDVKTFSMMMETLKAAAGTGWTDTFETVIGTLPEATKMWTSLTNVIQGFIGASADARNTALGVWKSLGGREVLINSIRYAFFALTGVLKPIKDAFKEIFPATTGKQLYDLTVSIKEFMYNLIPAKETSENIKRTFKGLFAVIGIGTTIFKEFIGYIAGFFSLINGGGGGGAVTDLTGGIGDLLVKLHEWLVTGGRISAFFDMLSNARAKVLGPLIEGTKTIISVLSPIIQGAVNSGLAGLSAGFDALAPIVANLGQILKRVFGNIGDVLGPAISYIRNLGSMFDINDQIAGAKTGINNVKEALKSTAGIGDKVRAAWQSVVNEFKSIAEFLAPVWGFLQSIFGELKSKIMTFVKDMGIEEGLALVNTGFFIAMYSMFRNFLKSMKGLTDSLSGTIDSASGVLDQVTSNLKTMQADVKADIILKIAVSLGVLAAAIWVLSTIDNKKLGIALGVITVMLLQLVIAMKKLESSTDLKGAASMALLSIGLVGLSVALLAMTAAIAILGNMDTGTLLKGIGSIAVILAIVVNSAKILSASGGAGQILIASAAILVLSVALTAFSGALKLYASLDTGMMAEGGAKIAAALLVIALTMSAMPPNMLASAAGLVLVSGALVIMAGALKAFGSMSVPEIAKSLIVLAGALHIIARALMAMTGTVSGAAALLLLAAALAVLVPTLVILGSLSLSTIGKALLAIAGIFVVLGLAAYVLSPLTPVIMLLATAIKMLGIAALAVGAGMLLFSMGLATLAASGAAGVAVLTVAIIAIAQLFPLIMHQFGLGLIAFAKVMSTAGPALSKAFTVLLESMIAAVIKILPRLGDALTKFVETILNVLKENVPKIIATGIFIIMALLTGIEKNIGRVARTVGKIIVNFLDALGDALPKVIEAGVQFILKFINGLSNTIDSHSEEMGRAGGRLAGSIVTGMVNGISGGLDEIRKAAGNLAKSAYDSAMSFLKAGSPSKLFEKVGQYVNQGFALGLVGSREDVIKALTDMQTKLRDLMTSMNDTVTRSNDRLNTLMSAKKKNWDLIDQAKKTLASSQEMQRSATAAHKDLIVNLKKEKNQLVALGAKYDVVSEKLKTSIKDLETAQKEMADANTKITAQYTRLPSISGKIGEAKKAKDDAEKATLDAHKARADADKAQVDLITKSLPAFEKDISLASYRQLLAQKTADTEKFVESLATLRNLGLDDASYNKFVNEGFGIQPFIDELIANGPEAVADIDNLAAALGAASSKLSAQIVPETTKEIINAGSPLDSYLAELKTEAAANNVFLASLAQLRSMGLDKVSYEKFVNEGVTIQPFINELIASGPTGVAEINKLTVALGAAASKIGTTASIELYQAGVNSAKALVAGLESQQAAIERQMSKIASTMIRALKKKLRIKSPSQEFEDIGKYSNEGLSHGLDKYSDLVKNSASGVGDTALTAIKKTMSGISNAISGEANMNPVIAPVLDLTQFRKDASQINGMINANSIAASVSYDQAASISASRAEAMATEAETAANPVPTTLVQLEQNNFSPTALSSVDIYRQTRNQLSLVREALNA